MDATNYVAMLTRSKIEETLPHIEMHLMDLRKHLHVIDRTMCREALLARGSMDLSERVDFVYLWMGGLTALVLGMLGWGWYHG